MEAQEATHADVAHHVAWGVWQRLKLRLRGMALANWNAPSSSGTTSQENPMQYVNVLYYILWLMMDL